MELKNLSSTFWRDNSLLLLPQSEAIAKDLQLNIDSRVYNLSADGWISEVYKISVNNVLLTVRSLGNVFDRNFSRNVESIWERRSNLSEIHLNIVYANFSPYVMPADNGKSVTGYHGDLFKMLQEKLKFKFTLIENNTFLHGQNIGNGSYDGMIGMLQRGESNWSLSRFGYTEGRSQVIDFSNPISYTPKRIVTTTPKDNLNWFSFCKVFAPDFWLVLMASILVLSFSLFLILKYQRSNLYSSSFAFTFPMASLCCREINKIDTSWAGKILIVFILGWGFLISSAYNAILTSELAVTKITPILNFEDLLNSDRYTLIARNIGQVSEILRNASEHETRKGTTKFFEWQPCLLSAEGYCFTK